MPKQKTLLRSPLTLALATALLLPTGAAWAQSSTGQTTTTQDQDKKDVTNIEKVVVTGSLIPQTELETATPLTIITAEDIQARGFNTVAEVVQGASFATGGVQNNQSSASFTQGAETMSMFGLPAGYVKYLIDGRPMANYPALYNGSDVFNNISGIPIDLVDRIEILPGGASSTYGSDAIAGVVNFVLKKHINGTVVSGRYGWYDQGGGRSMRGSISDSFSGAGGRLNVLVGVQAEKRDPIWAYQRDLTSQFNTQGHTWTIDRPNRTYNKVPSAPLASRDWLVYGYKGLGEYGFDNYGYAFVDPANCQNLTSAFGGTVGKRSRTGSGDYCGSFATPGYRTLRNSKDSVQLYSHVTYEMNENADFYGDVLLNAEKVKYHVGSGYTWWGTGIKWGYYYDPALDGLVNLQRAFAPEDMGDWKKSMNESASKSYGVSAGFRGTFGGESTWDYDIGVSRTEYRLDAKALERLADPINNFFQKKVLGPQKGWDPYYGAYPVFTPDYAAFYKTMTPAEFDSFMGTAVSKSRTYDNLFRAMFTNMSLFSLPGGDAGIAVGGEVGTEGWSYVPDPRYMNGEIWGTTDVSGGGKRSRYAVLSELRLPIFDPLTVTASARYDGYRARGYEFTKPTYSLAFEYRPIKSLLVRGKYGTAFRAPSLADQFQGLSGFYSSTVDYYNCQLAGYEPDNIAQCPARYTNVQYFGQQAGNPELNPINAKAWTAGIMFAPSARFSISADYLNWDIQDEVSQQSVGQLMLDEMLCRTGRLDKNSGTCVAALSQVKRGPTGALQQIYVSKINIAQRTLEAVNMGLNYRQAIGSFGDLSFSTNYTRNLKHLAQTYPTDPVADLLNDPYYSSDPKYRANASLGWQLGRFNATLYADHIGPTPNYRAQLQPEDATDAFGKPIGGYNNYGAGRLGSWTTYNASLGFDITPDLGLSLMVNNVTDKMPTMDVANYPGNNGAPFNSSNFNPYGRAFYLEARWNFGKTK